MSDTNEQQWFQLLLFPMGMPVDFLDKAMKFSWKMRHIPFDRWNKRFDPQTDMFNLRDLYIRSCMQDEINLARWKAVNHVR